MWNTSNHFDVFAKKEYVKVILLMCYKEISTYLIYDLKPGMNFSSYVEPTCTGKKMRKEIYNFKKPSMYGLKIWNVHNWIKRDLPLTNNASEGFNSNYTISSAKKPCFLQTIKAFQREDVLSKTRCTEANNNTSGSSSHSARKEKLRKKWNHVKRSTEDYELHNICTTLWMWFYTIIINKKRTFDVLGSNLRKSKNWFFLCKFFENVKIRN